MSDKVNIEIIYDGECPFCRNYVQFMNIKSNPKYSVSLINAREHNDVATCYKHSGFDLNDGMIVTIDGQMHYGSQAVYAMAMLASNDTFAKKVNFFIFKHKALSSILYPFMKAGRAITLKILGRNKIETG